ncbi:tyrosine--tRNA ligase [Gammaproteobacteria bacterium 54_18_T64]|nr:tyrosine--tRNA ligase [Gammaproteobacteria bacterium 54_18_T64]
MAKVDRGLIGDLQGRGLVAQMTGEGGFAEHLAERRVLYCGFDPTADSLHIGSLVPLLALRRFQLAGHKPIALVGGATGLIGDPSFKAQERQLNTPDVVAAWSERLRQQVSRFIDFDGGACSAEMANNHDWMGDMPVLDFLRDVGKHFAVNAMIHKESVKTRIEREGEGISYTEFSYMLLQSYDFAELYKRFGCTLQIGGSDQWGNITGGIDLVRRMHRASAFGLTLPLITKSDGSKFGKTESGTIWLDPAKTSPYAFYQFWVNVADQDVYRFLHYFTFLSLAELQDIERADEQVQGKKSAQGILAREVTRLVHGDEGVAAAERISAALFSGALGELTEGDLGQLALDGMPSSDIETGGVSLLDALVSSGLALTPRGEVTQGQARKFIRDGAVRVNGEQVRDESAALAPSSAYFGRYHLLRRGKKHFHLLRWV